MAQVNAGRVRFVSRGEYNNSTQYYLFDLVDYNGSSYFAKANTTGNVPTNTTYWQLVAEKGNIGGDGPVGPTGNGIASITKTASAGLIDTYTITFTNGSTTTFNVTNGQDGDVTQEYVDEENERLKSVFNVLPKVNGSGESVTLENTGDTMLYKMDLKGNTSQEVVSGEVGLEVEDTSIYVDDVNEDKENYITLKGNTYQETTTGKNLLNCNNFVASTINGITFTPVFNDNGTLAYINANGTSTSIVWKSLGNLTYDADTYTFYANSTDTNLRLYQDYPVSYVVTSQTVTFSESITKPIFLNIESGKTLNNAKIYPMVAKATSISSYEPYTNGASPNPDYPQEIEVVTGENVVKVEGKNLVSSYAKSGNIVFLNGTRSYESYIFKAGTYTISYKNENTATTSIKDTIGTQTNLGSNKIITFTSNYDFNIWFYRSGITTDEFSEVQLERSNTKTDYEPYQSQSYPINLGSIELCKIGTYQDRIYKSNGNWYLHKEVGKVVLDGSESTLTTHQFGTNSYQVKISNSGSGGSIITAISNSFLGIPYNDRSSAGSNVIYTDTNTLVNTVIRNTSYTSLDDFKTWLSTHNTEVYYALATPTETQITDTTLVNQLNALYNATIYSTTHINTETSNLLPYIDLKYNVVTASPSPDRASEVEVVKGNNTITISNEDGTKTQTYNITLGNLEFCKIGNYQDYFYKSNGNWYKYNAIGKVVLDGSNDEEFTNYQYDNSIAMYKDNNLLYITGQSSYCDRFSLELSSISNMTNGEYRISVVSNNTYILFKSEETNNISAFKTWLSNHNTNVYGILATPTTTQITDQLLVSQLDELQKAMSYYDKTLITQTNASKPFILDVVGIRDLQDIFNL